MYANVLDYNMQITNPVAYTNSKGRLNEDNKQHLVGEHSANVTIGGNSAGIVAKPRLVLPYPCYSQAKCSDRTSRRGK